MLSAGLLQIDPASADSRCLEFQVAAMQNETGNVTRFLDGGVDVNCRDPLTSETALMKAAFNGSVEAVRILLDRGADANIRADNGRTALDYAVASHRAVKQGGPSFARLTAKIEAVIQLLRQEKGVE